MFLQPQPRHPPPSPAAKLLHNPMTSDMLVQLAFAGDLFHTSVGTAFADIHIDGRRETWPIRSKRFRSWLRKGYYEETGAAPAAGAIKAALDLVEARAQFDGPERKVHLRVAEQCGRIYLDLSDEMWRAIEITPDGWRVVSRPPIRFRRPAGLLPIPLPQRGGSIELLAPYLNLVSRDDLVLTVTWLLSTLLSDGPYPALVISGEQGSSKTVLAKILKSLIDPNAAPARALPREDRELFIAANNSHVLAFDNLSNIPSGLSDTLCRLASGGSFAVRQLYTDQDEALFDAARPLILNGIEDFVTRPDLADRAIFLTLAPIAEAGRRPERELWRDFEGARPRILGALLDAAAHGLRRLPEIQVQRLPRMADFARWGMACETAMWPAGTFLRAYEANRRAAIERVADSDPVAACVREIMTERSTWSGCASDLYRTVAHSADSDGSKIVSGWPKNPRALAGRLRRVQTPLRTLGVEITFGREGRAGTRVIRMSKVPEISSVPSATSATMHMSGQPG
jgi:hypothetical protein